MLKFGKWRPKPAQTNLETAICFLTVGERGCVVSFGGKNVFSRVVIR